MAQRAGRLTSGPVIREAATRLFLERGYAGTSMDDIAAAAQVSKQTIYTHFANKEELFTDLVLANAARVEEFAAGLPHAVAEGEDLETALRRLARSYLRLVVRPEVLSLRRLVLGEAGRFPELARTYHERVPERVYKALASLFEGLARAGRLDVKDTELAAHQFAWLILGLPLDRGMFRGADQVGKPAALDRIADEGVRVFLAAYARS